MRGDLTIKLLEFAKNFPGYSIDSIEAFLRAGYGASMSKMDFEFNKLRKRRELIAEERRERDRIYKLLFKLKRDGLIAEITNKDGRRAAKLTASGKRKLEELKKQRSAALPSLDYNKEAGNRFVIVAFDVPEYERKKRNWLRGALGAIGLKMIQQSVWIGKAKIPPPFIEDICRLKMTDYVEILEVTKTGSLKHLA